MSAVTRTVWLILHIPNYFIPDIWHLNANSCGKAKIFFQNYGKNNRLETLLRENSPHIIFGALRMGAPHG